MTVEPSGSSSKPDPYESEVDKIAADLPGKGISSKGFTFLGMQFTGADAKVLWQTLVQSAAQQIQTEQDQAVQAIQQMNPDNNPDNQ